MGTDQKEERKETIDIKYQVVLKIYRGKTTEEIDRYTKREEILTLFRRFDYRFLILESGKIIRTPYGYPSILRLDYLLDSDITSKPFYVSSKSYRSYPEPHLQLEIDGLPINIILLRVIPE